MTGSTNNTVLLAEDSPAAIILVERAFRRSGMDYALQIVRDGREAVYYLNGDGRYGDRVQYPLPVLLMTNIKMPNLSGFELLTWVRRKPEFQSLPVVVISSSELDSDSNQAYELGANSYLVKPISTEALIEVLRSIDSTAT